MKKKSNLVHEIFNNWDDLQAHLNNKFGAWPNYIFRGHSNSDWLLESTLSRVLKKIELKGKSTLIKTHFERFKLEIRGRRGLNPKTLTEDELWSLGQHYGLHTPLLDWSQSPYVALFFALASQEKSPTGYRTLWIFNTADIADINLWYSKKGSKKNKWKVDLVNPIVDENGRLVSQNGLFTKISDEVDIETYVANGPDIGWLTLNKINFPDSIRDTALVHLDLMNINYTSLFSDIFGSSMNTNMKLEQTDFINQRQKEDWDKK